MGILNRSEGTAADKPKSSIESKSTVNLFHDVNIRNRAKQVASSWLERNRNLVLRQTPVWAQSMAAILIGLGGLAVAGGILFRIDEVVTVQGQLKSIGGTVEVKSPAGGQVAEVFFKDGDVVKKGSLLLRFDTRQAVEEKSTLIRLIGLEQSELKTRLATLDSQRLTLTSRESVLEQRLATKSKIIGKLKDLTSVGAYQELQYLDQKDQLFELRKQIGDIAEQKNQIQLYADQTRLETSKSVNQMKNRLKQVEVQLQYQTIYSPVDGIIFDPKARIQGVLSAGERILSIVPQNGLYAEVFVPNKDIGFIKPGQMSKVRVDAFPFTRYGELAGEVSQIAADALPPDQEFKFYRFPVKLKLDKSFLESNDVRIPLQAGMAITGNLKLREKRVISLISDLLVDQTDSIRSIRQQ